MVVNKLMHDKEGKSHKLLWNRKFKILESGKL